MLTTYRLVKDAVAKDEYLENIHQFQDQMDDLAQKIDEISDRLEGKHLDVSDPLYKDVEQLIASHNKLGKARANLWKNWWDPFQVRWGDHQNRSCVFDSDFV